MQHFHIHATVRLKQLPPFSTKEDYLLISSFILLRDRFQTNHSLIISSVGFPH